MHNELLAWSPISLPGLGRNASTCLDNRRESRCYGLGCRRQLCAFRLTAKNSSDEEMKQMVVCVFHTQPRQYFG